MYYDLVAALLGFGSGVVRFMVGSDSLVFCFPLL